MAPRLVKKTTCHQCLTDDDLLQHSTRTEAERTDSSLDKQGKKGHISMSVISSNSLSDRTTDKPVARLPSQPLPSLVAALP